MSKTAEQWAEGMVEIVETRNPSFVGNRVMFRVQLGTGETALPLGAEVSDRAAAESLRSMFVDVLESQVEHILESRPENHDALQERERAIGFIEKLKYSIHVKDDDKVAQLRVDVAVTLKPVADALRACEHLGS